LYARNFFQIGTSSSPANLLKVESNLRGTHELLAKKVLYKERKHGIPSAQSYEKALPQLAKTILFF
jgi:hypothetical protein